MVSATGIQAPAVPSDTALSCANVDTRSLKQLRKFDLAPSGGSHTCVFAATVGKNKPTMISIREAQTYYPMVTQLASSRKAKAPIFSASNSLSGKVTLLHVAKGVTLTDGKSTAPSSRDLEVLVWHEALGLTAKQGKQLAIRVAMGVEGAPPTPTAQTTH